MAMGILQASSILDSCRLGTRRSLDSMASQNFTSVGHLEMVFKDSGILAGGMNPSSLKRTSKRWTEPPRKRDICNDLQFSFGRYSPDSLVSVKKVMGVMGDDVGSELFGKDVGGSKVSGQTASFLYPPGWGSWFHREICRGHNGGGMVQI